MAKILYGSEISEELKTRYKETIDELRRMNKRIPHLAVVLVGEDPASLSYVRGKDKACAQIGMKSSIIKMAEHVSQQEVIEQICRLNEDPNVDGILVQLPLPKGLDSKRILQRIDPQKDVDGLHPVNVAKLYGKEEGFVPCTPQGVMELLKRCTDSLAGKQAVVLGRSDLVGTPLARLLLNADATVTICHSKTANLASICRQCDIVIAAVGKAKMVKSSWIKSGAVVIDVGVNRNEAGKLVGDVDFEEVKEVASVITPVPKGVGPMTIAMLLKNTLKSYFEREKDHAGIWIE